MLIYVLYLDSGCYSIYANSDAEALKEALEISNRKRVT